MFGLVPRVTVMVRAGKSTGRTVGAVRPERFARWLSCRQAPLGAGVRSVLAVAPLVPAPGFAGVLALLQSVRRVRSRRTGRPHRGVGRAKIRVAQDQRLVRPTRV